MTMFVKRQSDGPCLYHISYQYYHAHTQWGPPSQATAVSRDGIHWEDYGDVRNPSVLQPGATAFDTKGIYDGTIVPGVTFRVSLRQNTLTD
jgi:sucrose-6-phosphate hydrolase SacC (GH32 family)